MDTAIASAVEIIQNQDKQTASTESPPSAATGLSGDANPPSQGNPQTGAKDGQGTEGLDGQKPESPADAAAKKPEEKQSELISKRFATLSLKEREVQRAQAQLKREREEFDRQRAEKGDPKAKTYDDPLELLEAFGFSYDDATSAALHGVKPEAKKAREVERKLAQLEKERQAEKEAQAKDQAEREQRQQEQNYISGLKSQVDANPERFELIKQFGDAGIKLLYDSIVSHYKEYDEVPNVLEIADKVEAYYDGQLKSEIEKFKSTKKLGSLFQLAQGKPSESQASKPEVKAEAESVTGTKTLTNSQSQTATKTAQRQLSDDEMIAEAAKLISAR